MCAYYSREEEEEEEEERLGGGGGFIDKQRECAQMVEFIYVYYCRTYEKAVSGEGEREKGGHVLRDTKT